MRAVVCWIGMFLSFASLQGQEKLLDNAYFPLKLDSRWTYQSGKKMVTLSVAKIDAVNKVPCAVLESEREGLTITEHVTVKQDGVYRVKSLSFLVDPPVCFLKTPGTAKRWTGEATIGGESYRAAYTQEEGKVTVPAGEFQALIVHCTVDRKRGDKLLITSYYARDHGMVKQVQKLGDKEFVLELVKYEK